MSSIYHYFGGKEGLLVAIIQKSATLMACQMPQVCQKDMDPMDQLKALMNTHVHQTIKQMQKAKVINLDEERLSPQATKVSHHIQLEILDLYGERLRNLGRLGYARFKSLTS
jgi:AcrR family transcriptional regulator